MRLGRFFFLGLFTVILTSCGETVESPSSIAPVYYEASLQLPAMRPLLAPGGIVLVTQADQAVMSTGLMGLALVRSLTTEEYYAFDLACPVDASPHARLELKGVHLSCPRCGSRFDILSGSGIPSEGPSQRVLYRYRAIRTARGTLRITS